MTRFRRWFEGSSTPVHAVVCSVVRTLWTTFGTDTDAEQPYQAVSDDPCCLFVEELIAAYPDAKVILTVRPRAEWLRSMQKFILEILSWRSLPILCFLDREFMGPYIALLSRTTSVLSQGYIPNKSSAYPAFLESYDKHIDNVRRAVPEGKLLEFHPDQGWHSLCTFLNKPTPDGPYPHLNNSQDAMRKEHSLYWSRWCCVGETMAKTVCIVMLVTFAALLVR